MKRLVAGIGVGSVAMWMLLACVGDKQDLGTVTAGKDAGSGEAGPNLLERGEFEDGDCLGWTPNEASRTHDPIKNGGQNACRVCIESATSGPTWGIFQTAKNLPAGTYTVTAFVHPSGDQGPNSVVVAAKETNAAGEDVGTDPPEQHITLAVTDSWRPASLRIVNLADGDNITVAILSDNIAKGCFLVDDVTLTKTK